VAVVCLVSVLGVVDPVFGLGLVLVVLVPYVGVLAAHGKDFRRLPIPRQWVTWLAAAVAEEEVELADAIRPERGRPRDAFEAAGALVVVVAASVTMERGASALGTHYAVAGIVLGGLVLAAVTSLPNAVAAVYLAAKGRGVAALSTALHSNALNVALGLLLPAAFIGLAKPSGEDTLVAAWYVGLTALTLTLAYKGRGLRRWAGWVIIVGYAAFAVSLLVAS
jgi:Ca2+/Na+ antiporter